VTPKFALAFALPTSALVVANPLEWTFTDQTTLSVVGGVTATAAEGVPGVVNRLFELPATVRVAAVVPEFVIWIAAIRRGGPYGASTIWIRW
jgi:hypothetical protein